MKQIFAFTVTLLLVSCSHSTIVSDYDRGVTEGMAQCQFNYDKWKSPEFRAFCAAHPERSECAR